MSLSSDGTIVAIGASHNDDSGTNSGHVRVYDWTGSTWEKMGDDIEGDSARGSGFSVSLNSDGTIVAVGAPWSGGNDCLRSSSCVGHVRIYEWTGTTWEKMGDDIDGESEGDESGISVSLNSNGTIVAIGAHYNDNDNGDYSGHVRILEWTGSTWEKMGDDIDGESTYDLSGYSVSLNSDGTIVAIGAPGHDSHSGHARVYEWTGTTWEQMGDDIDGDSSMFGSDQMGVSVSLNSDGTIVAIGGPFYGGLAPWLGLAGVVRIHKWTGSAWEKMGSDIAGESPGDKSGGSVSLNSDGTIVAIGPSFAWNAFGGESNHVRIFEWTGSTWEKVGGNIEG